MNQTPKLATWNEVQKAFVEHIPYNIKMQTIEYHDEVNVIKQLAHRNYSSATLNHFPNFSQNISEDQLIKLGLPGYKVHSSPEQRRNIFLKFQTDIMKFYPIEYACIKQFTKCIIWIEPNGKDYQPISSTTFYQLPYCTILTDAVFKCMAPDIVLPQMHYYTLFDNLYHEALHQQLISSIWLGLIFSQECAQQHREEAKIFVHWRNTYWGLEHALQAAYVYVNLAKTRSQQLEYEKDFQIRDNLQMALIKAQNGANELLNGLINSSHYFSLNGILLLQWMQSMINSNR